MSELDGARGLAERKLREHIRSGLFALTAECLGSMDMTILTALGIDPNEKLLEIFNQEITYILTTQEAGDAGSGPL